MSATIRSVENETELQKVFDLLHQVNPTIPREYYSARVRSEPNFDFWQTRIALENNKAIATVQIFDKKMWLNGTEVQFGGLGHLAVSPDYKSNFNYDYDGLLKDTLDMLIEFGYPLSVVFTADNNFYSNL